MEIFAAVEKRFSFFIMDVKIKVNTFFSSESIMKDFFAMTENNFALKIEKRGTRSSGPPSYGLHDI